MKIQIKKLDPRAALPAFAHDTDAGMDIFCLEDVKLEPGQVLKIRTGLAFELSAGYALLIWDKSSVGALGVKTLGGVVDAGFRGEVHVVCVNLSPKEVSFTSGQKIAQIIVQKVEHPEIEEVESLSETERGEGAFGSTGRY